MAGPFANTHEGYHAHVYYGEENFDEAQALCERVAREVPGVEMGTMHRKLVGPHVVWSCRLTFGPREFDTVIPWLEKNRGEFDVLVHALTGDELVDHTDFVWWLGRKYPLDLSKL